MTKAIQNNSASKSKYWSKLGKDIKRTWILYVFLAPSLIYLFLFSYLPLYGIQIAFKNFKPNLGIWESDWIGFQHFESFFNSYHFWDLLSNTIILSLYALIAGFPIPIILALILNYMKNQRYKKFVQTITYAPHFISTVVFVGMITTLLASDGVVNQILGILGIDPIGFMTNPQYFRHVYVWSGVIQGMGWSSIIYISTLASVSPELHEAATVDGATKFQRIRYIDFPSLLPTAIILLILSAGSILNVGFEKAFLMQNPVNLDYSEIISTYVYKVGIQSAQYSYSTAIGLFNNIVNFIIVIIVNKFSKVASGTSLW